MHPDVTDWLLEVTQKMSRDPRVNHVHFDHEADCPITMIRNDPNFARLPVLMVSGKVTLREITDILELGASRFLPKPIEVKHLQAYLRSLIVEEDEKQPGSRGA